MIPGPSLGLLRVKAEARICFTCCDLYALMCSDSIGRSVQIEARRASNVAFSLRLFVQSSKVLSVMAVGNLLQSFAQSTRQVEKPYSGRNFRDAALVSYEC